MRIFELFLLIGLIVCALSVSFTKRLLTSIIIYMSYSSIMAIIWVILQSPDLAVTEAAVGAGVTSILFFVTLKKIRAIQEERQETEAAAPEPGASGRPGGMPEPGAAGVLKADRKEGPETEKEGGI